jgi:hypothetical protein
MSTIFGFGESVEGYDVPVMNEREVRAAAGILFVFAMMTFANAWFMGNFRPTKIFVIAFLIDFTIRMFINPRYCAEHDRGALCGARTGAGVGRCAAEALRLGHRLGTGGDHALADRDQQRDRADQHAGLCHLPDADVLRERLRHLHRLQDLQRPAEPPGATLRRRCLRSIHPAPSQKVGAGGTAIVLLFLALVGLVGQRGFPAADTVTPAVPAAAVAATIAARRPPSPWPSATPRSGSCTTTAAGAIAQILPPLRRHRRPSQPESTHKTCAPKPPTPSTSRTTRPPAWLIDTVDLHVAIHDGHAEVRARLACRRNPANPQADLVLNGEELTLREVGADGTALAPSRYTLGDET